ncbi:MAG: hypothetical protein IJQ78_09300 [Selenomonadaceae bacterium]|nr:hypothetical protein [Selenomonadaceae bacterium]
MLYDKFRTKAKKSINGGKEHEKRNENLRRKIDGLGFSVGKKLSAGNEWTKGFAARKNMLYGRYLTDMDEAI